MLDSIIKLSPNSLGIFISGDLNGGGKIAEYEKHIEIHSNLFVYVYEDKLYFADMILKK